MVNGFQSLTIIRRRSILDVAAVLDPPLLLGLCIGDFAQIMIRSGLE